jgi:glycosyltransferase involved in cell wall biosynthesis
MLAPEFIPVWGGTGSYTVELVKSLPREMDIHVVTLKRYVNGSSGDNFTSKSVEPIIKRPINVHYLTESKETFFYNLPFQLACLRKIPSLVKDYGLNVIHSHMCHMPDVYQKMFNKIDVPTVVTIHGTIQMLHDHAIIARDLFNDLETGEKSILRFYPIIRQLQQTYVKRVTKFIAVSNKTKELAQEHFGVEPEKISVVYNGIDDQLFHLPSPEEESTKYSNPTIVYVGRIISKKGIDVLIKTMPEVIKAFPKARFLFVGGGNIEFYDELVKNKGISKANYTFTGHMGYLERSKIVREATVFVNPSFFENCSISILEAMGSGCTVVASDIGGNPELIKSGRNGLLFPIFDHGALAEQIISLLKHESENRSLGGMARKTVEASFSSKKCAEATYNLYKKL